jgi:hypothetical protein
MNKGFKTITVDMTEETFMRIAMEAHKLDITFNKCCNQILMDVIKNEQCRNRKSKQG